MAVLWISAMSPVKERPRPNKPQKCSVSLIWMFRLGRLAALPERVQIWAVCRYVVADEQRDAHPGTEQKAENHLGRNSIVNDFSLHGRGFSALHTPMPEISL
jgi:hypothetical protein